MADSQQFIKIVMLGEGRVGKTSLTVRYCQNNFDDEQEQTVDASYLEKNIALDNGHIKNLAIWDTAGQEKFHALNHMYYKDALGAVIVYDITFKESFEKVKKWLVELNEFAQRKIVVCIAGNKSDMELKRQVPKDMAENFAQKNNAKHFSTSAKAGIGLEDMFKYLATEVEKIQEKKLKFKSNNLVLSKNNFEKQKPQTKRCC